VAARLTELAARGERHDVASTPVGRAAGTA
jgi:hypothetical protein